MTDHDALAATIRAYLATGGDGLLPDLPGAYLDLYDEVKRLRAHNLEQNAELHRAVQDRAHWQTRCEAAHASEGRLMAERDALRATLANALDACRIVDAAAKEGHERIGDLVLHMLSAVEPARAALKGETE